MELFPIPVQPPSALSLSQLPGASPEATKALQEVLSVNHKNHHIIFNDERGFHNHISHHALAIWALGGDQNVIRSAYGRFEKYQRKSLDSPEPITSANFNDHLGDRSFWSGYLKFFHDLIIVQQKGIPSVLEQYLFSPEANFGVKNSVGEHPQMLSRLVDGLLHPAIHLGYGAEFGLPGMIVEGLAQTAVHRTELSPVIPASMFVNKSVSSSVENLASRLQTATFVTPKDNLSSDGTHAFTILARILKDPGMKIRDGPGSDPGVIISYVMKNHGDALFKYAMAWDVDTSDPTKLNRKIAELQWLNTILYALSGFKRGQGDKFHADFFNMHLVTSSIFLPSIVALLTPASQEVFLRAYLVACLAWYIARGRPDIDIEPFFTANTALPSLGVKAPVNSLALLPASHPSATNPNPWLPIIQQAILHQDDHVAKIQRALAHHAKVYGSRVAGLPDFANTELPGADKLDGTLFIRAAGLTAQRLGRDFGSEDQVSYWDRTPFFKD
ncbi:hypothetical protein K435DRAFT_752874 [Dendrothele bispora CBS 962.96]|uniref:Oxidoreductase AflY n=1 Tax=Dendrothele bispora (strain CBS 962.96) TaxID=1314807 RepID=A0A4S8M874_DENBC|nr:hypothetical protein K435DRAFT_752874 [Dendrothele bispora CBS 962.96]